MKIVETNLDFVSNQNGDWMALYTDGIVSAQGHSFSDSDWADLFEKYAPHIKIKFHECTDRAEKNCIYFGKLGDKLGDVVDVEED